MLRRAADMRRPGVRRSWCTDAPERVNVLGVGVSAITMADALATSIAGLRPRCRQYVCVTGVHGVMESQADPITARHSQSCRTRHARRHAVGVALMAPRASPRGAGIWSRSDACLLRSVHQKRAIAISSTAAVRACPSAWPTASGSAFTVYRSSARGRPRFASSQQRKKRQ